MDVVWFVPVTVLIVGSVLAVAGVRRLAAALTELADAQRRVARVEHALVPLRVESRRTRASIEQIHRR